MHFSMLQACGLQTQTQKTSLDVQLYASCILKMWRQTYLHELPSVTTFWFSSQNLIITSNYEVLHKYVRLNLRRLSSGFLLFPQLSSEIKNYPQYLLIHAALIRQDRQVHYCISQLLIQ